MNLNSFACAKIFNPAVIFLLFTFTRHCNFLHTAAALSIIQYYIHDAIVLWLEWKIQFECEWQCPMAATDAKNVKEKWNTWIIDSPDWRRVHAVYSSNGSQHSMNYEPNAVWCKRARARHALSTAHFIMWPDSDFFFAPPLPPSSAYLCLNKKKKRSNRVRKSSVECMAYKWNRKRKNEKKIWWSRIFHSLNKDYFFNYCNWKTATRKKKRELNEKAHSV